MASNLLHLLVALLALMTGIETGIQGPPPASTHPPGTVSSLAEAMTFTPRDVTELFFTDWSLLKTYEGAEAVTSVRPLDERINFLRAIGRTQAAATSFALPYAAEQAELWGWDSTDLSWEATFSGDQPPVYVLRLRDDLDLEALIARFEERAFARRSVGDALVFNHDLDPTVPWRTELGVFNAAILPARHVLIHSSSPDTLDAVLGAYLAGDATWATLPAPRQLAMQLGPTAAAAISVAPGICGALGSTAALGRLAASGRVTEAQVEELRQRLLVGPQVHPYLALGIGYLRDATGALGTVAMVYPTGEAAAADLEARRTLAAEGFSTASGAPYREQSFVLEEAAVAGPNLLLRLRPHEDRPQRLFEMFYRRDMTFAACP